MFGSRCVLISALTLLALQYSGAQQAREPDKKPPATTADSPSSSKPSPIPELNGRIVELCKGRLGQRVGDGQCSSLAQAALASAGAQFRFRESPLSGDYVWGSLVCRLEFSNGRIELEVCEAGKKTGGAKGADVKPGDVIQFRDVELRGRTGRIIYEKTRPHHTAVIESLSEDGTSCTVLEQNVEGKDFVVRTVLQLSDLAKGWLRVYRPISKSVGATNR